ncbi:MAG: N-acetylglucosamine-specific PTS transporter subunit IIBC [Rhizomicrobium sp.]
MKSFTEILQPLGRALMLPIVVLPVAGLMLRLGQPDLFNLPFVAAAGGAVFSGLGLLFAVGVAVGLAKENHGAAGLAGCVCFLVATAGAKAILPVPPAAFAGFGAAAHDLAAEAFRTDALQKLGVPIGIISGVMAGGLYNRFYDIKLPEYLAFFGGRRFVPIVAGFAALILAAIIGVGEPTIARGMDVGSHAVLSAGAFGLFMYGVLNRLLIVTGLHHILNNLAWFIVGDYHGTTGDLKRFFAGDPSAGTFMSGFFPVMMFGLPAACLAMYHAVRPERRKAVGGLLASMALTAFLTGVTEPIEFSFMFLAPPLFAIHAVLTGVSMILMDALHVRLGFSFSAGFFDYVINFNKASCPLLLLPVGAVYFAVYYATFRFTISAFDLKTPGREDDAPQVKKSVINAQARGRAFLDALGGAENLQSVDACMTRLRLVLESSTAVDEHQLKALGARGFVRPSSHTLQVVLGPIADQVAGDIRAVLAQSGQAPRLGQELSPSETPSGNGAGLAPDAVRALVRGLGGRENVRALSTCSSRLLVSVANPALVVEDVLRAAGVRGIVKLRDSVQVVVGPKAEEIAGQLRAELGLTAP